MLTPAAHTDLPTLKQRYAVAAAEFAARVRKLSEVAGGVEVDAFTKLWDRCDEARRVCVQLNRQISGQRHALSKNLTSREEEILKLVAEGLSNKEVATTLGVSVKTVEFHKTRIYERLSLSGIADLVRYAIRMGLITP